MKKKFILIICCIAIAVSGIAQPQRQKPKPLFPKSPLSSKMQIVKPLFPKSSLSSKMQIVKPLFPKSPLSREDWWEPDTIYHYSENEYYTIETRRIFSYSNGKCTGELWQNWKMNQWNIEGRIVHTYDTQDNKIETLIQEWESGNQWSNSMRYVYKYDEQNNKTEERWQFWEGYWADWEMKTYVYDSSNRMIEMVIYSDWDDGLEVDDKMVYKYDEQNNLIEERHQYLEDEEEWEDYEIVTYSYNEQNQLTGAMVQGFDDIWEDELKLTVLYDLENQTITHIYSFIDEDELWYDDIKLLYTCDSQNNLLSESWFESDEDEWEEYFSYNYSYDDNNNATEGYYVESNKKWFMWNWYEEPELTVYYNNMQSKIPTYDFQRFTATYIKPSEIGIVDNNLQNHSFTLYPNPTTGELQVTSYELQVTSIEVFDIYGRNVVTKFPSNKLEGWQPKADGVVFNISHLPSGIYFVKINGVSQKVVKL